MGQRANSVAASRIVSWRRLKFSWPLQQSTHMTATPLLQDTAWFVEWDDQRQDTSLAFLKLCSGPFPHGAKVTIHYSRVTFLGFTPAIRNFRLSSATNRNTPTCGTIKKDRRPCLS